MIHDDNNSITDQEVLTSVRRKRLIKETDEVSLLFSTMNIHGNSPETDKMISELGKKIAFCKYFYHFSDNKTYNDVFLCQLSYTWLTQNFPAI